MRLTNRILTASVALIALTVSTGCVTKKIFRRNVEETNSRIQGVESGLEENERRTNDLGKDTETKIASVRSTSEKALEVGNTAMSRA